MSEVNTVEWLEAIELHPDTYEWEADVALHMVLTGTANGVSVRCMDCDCGGMELLPDYESDEIVARLINLGFLESVVAVDSPVGGEDHLLVFRIPEAVI